MFSAVKAWCFLVGFIEPPIEWATSTRKKCWGGTARKTAIKTLPSRKIPLLWPIAPPHFDWPRSIDPCIEPGRLEQNRSLEAIEHATSRSLAVPEKFRSEICSQKGFGGTSCCAATAHFCVRDFRTFRLAALNAASHRWSFGSTRLARCLRTVSR